MIDKTKFEVYQQLLLDKRAELERATVMNEERLKLKTSLANVTNVLDKSYKHLLKLEQLKRIVSQEETNFRQRRITFLSEHITQELLKIFPSEGYQAKIDCDFKRGSGTASLVLVDKNNFERIPEITEGKLCQYLISFASTVGAIKGLGAENIYIDEAFGVSSTENLPKIGDILHRTVDDGMQIVLISQSAELYSDIPRREIHLKFDDNAGCASVVEVKDF